MSERLGLVPIGQVPDYLLEGLKPQIVEQYPWFVVERVDRSISSGEAYDPRRDQYHSTRLLVLLERQIDKLKMNGLLGVADIDLYVPGMNFVFGEARCPGRVGIISYHRLKPSVADQTELLLERMVKEAVHEIGHMHGLTHCSDALCVMYFSESLLDTDRKQTSLCSNCQSELKVLEAE